MKKSVKASYNLDREAIKQRLREKHHQRHAALSRALMDQCRNRNTELERNPEEIVGGGGGPQLATAWVPVPCSADGLHNDFENRVSSDNSGKIGDSTSNNSYQGFLEVGNAFSGSSLLAPASPLPISQIITDPERLPVKPFSPEEWTFFLEEVGCVAETPEMLACLIELEEEIRNEMFFQLYETSQQIDTEENWDEYYSHLMS